MMDRALMSCVLITVVGVANVASGQDVEPDAVSPRPVVSSGGQKTNPSQRSMVVTDDGVVVATGQVMVGLDDTAVKTWVFDADGTEITDPDLLWYGDEEGTRSGVAVEVVDDDIYVAAFDAADGQTADIIVLKYTPTEDVGDAPYHLEWEARYNNDDQNGADYPVDLRVVQGDVFVVGNSDGDGTGTDIVLLPFDGATGDPYWPNASYPNDGPPRFDHDGLSDTAVGLFVRSGFNPLTANFLEVFVAGTSVDSTTNQDYLFLRWDVYPTLGAPTGPSVNVRVDGADLGETANSSDICTALAHPTTSEQQSFGFFVTGYSDATDSIDILTMAFDFDGEYGTSNGFLVQWFDGGQTTQGADYGRAIDVSKDGQGNVVVGVIGDSYQGSSTGYDIAVATYDPLTNDFLWAHTFDGGAGLEDRGVDIRLHAEFGGDVEVYGLGKGVVSTGPDIITLRTSATESDLQNWQTSYGSPSNGANAASALSLWREPSSDYIDVFVNGRATGLFDSTSLGKVVRIRYEQVEVP